MRVLHVDPEPGWGGGEVQVAALIQELGARGHVSTLAAPRGAPLAMAVADVARVVDCPIANDLDVRCVPRLRALARDADVVHFHTARAHAMAPWLLGAGGRRVVTRRMDYVPRGGPWARLLYNRSVDRVIAISEGVRRALIAAGVRPERIRIVRSGVDPDALHPSDEARARLRREWYLSPSDVAVVVLGALEDRKGHRVLLEAAAGLADAPRLRYVFCGRGSLEAMLRAQADARRLPVTFAGFRADVAACLAAADIVVLPSLHEGLGVAALEAMAAARPVVASAVGGLSEVVADQVTGLLVPRADPLALATALTTLAADPARRAAMGAAGARRVRAHYSTTAMAEGTLACYLESA